MLEISCRGLHDKTALKHGQIHRGTGGTDSPPHPDGTDPIEKQLDPLRPIASQGDSIRRSLKHVDD